MLAALVHRQLLEVADQVGGARQVALDQLGALAQALRRGLQFGTADALAADAFEKSSA
jgi:hypothetical protein